MKQEPNHKKIYPRTNDFNTVYLKNVITSSNIIVDDFTMYNDFNNDPKDFEKKNVLYHYPYVNNDKLIIGKYCSIACGAKFIFNSANHTLKSLSTYPFPIFGEEWDDAMNVCEAWDNKGDIVIGNDVWIGFEAVIMSGVHIGDGAIIGTRALVTKDVPPYAIVGGIPAQIIRIRFEDSIIEDLLKIQWWNWSTEKISEKLTAIRSGDIVVLKE
ncbi:CatB-related O-acetyltransferase [Clostridium tagluense]|uniref:CatB-related O-acetyltransferase n=1 Tax=Clostridium tagluense TaxID=360422 RepID=UPI001C0CE421|nr:CatB-related O-acetyltransferase [Clostridium tagluense]MBU3129083.1 CatB-related O-acetyltransferase [Clostridium tagluense]MCB2311303.1 CatB-related O-acetyltransferase [Clostridium tagluense]MCB2316055.1 CatB-related O-acetyltransferase [Clostridium tagluense]MCB2320879.1 CatB-related O-acetyltransferase [Clostridium tagluense]MCB2325924.1 CatB-related O-acetyltransferase [Clostridium tagluense]